MPTALIDVRRLTLWTDVPGVFGGAQHGGGSAAPQKFRIRDSILRTTRAAGRRYITNVADYRSATGQGASTGLGATFVDAAWLDAQLVDPAGGDLRVRDSSVLAGLGAA